MRLDIAMPAVQRPLPFGLTLYSLCHHVLPEDNSRCRLVVNIDPVGPGTFAEMMAAIGGCFNWIEAHQPAGEPSLNRAVCWVWRRVQTPVFLHVEDDVEFLRPIDLQAMLACMEREKDLAYLAIPRRGFRPGDITSNKALKHTWEKDSGYHERTGQYAMSFGPGLMRTEFVKAAAALIQPTPDPEIQFHQHNLRLQTLASKWRYATWAKPDDPPAVRDTGRMVRLQCGWKKQVTEVDGTRWVKA